MDCKKTQNQNACNCSYPCSKKGICCDCIAYHRRMKQLPACYFPLDEEPNYDRSIDNFISIIKSRGTHYLN